MSLALNNSGLITRGMGPDHRVLTRGLGKDWEFGGVRFNKRMKEYSFGISMPVEKESIALFGIYSPLEINRLWSGKISSGISKELEESFNLLSKINNDKLFKILDEI